MSAITNFFKNLSVVSGFTLLSRILGFVRDLIQTIYLGANSISDAYEAARSMPSVVRKLTAEGLFNSAFVPIYAEIGQKESQEAADRWASSLFWIIILYAIALTIFMELILPFFLGLVYSGFLYKSSWPLLVTLSRILFLSIITSSLTAFLTTIWTAKKRFVLASIGSTICNIIIIGVSYLWPNVYGMSIAFLIGSLVQGLALIIPYRKHLYFTLKINKVHFKQFVKLLGPLAVTALIFQCLIIMGGWFGSWLPSGHLTYITKADRFLQLPLSLIGMTIGTVLLPILSRKQHPGYIKLSVQAGLLLGSFMIVLITSFSQEIAQLAFGYGKMTSIDTSYVGRMLFIYSFALPAWILLKVWSATLASVKNTQVSLSGNILHFMIYLCVAGALIGKYGMYALGIASVISVWCNCTYITYVIYKKGLFKHDRLFIKTCSIILGLVATSYLGLTAVTELTKYSSSLIKLMSGSVLVTFVYILGLPILLKK